MRRGRLSGPWRIRCRWWQPLSSGCERQHHWLADFVQLGRAWVAWRLPHIVWMLLPHAFQWCAWICAYVTRWLACDCVRHRWQRTACGCRKYACVSMRASPVGVRACESQGYRWKALGRSASSFEKSHLFFVPPPRSTSRKAESAIRKGESVRSRAVTGHRALGARARARHSAVVACARRVVSDQASRRLCRVYARRRAVRVDRTGLWLLAY